MIDFLDVEYNDPIRFELDLSAQVACHRKDLQRYVPAADACPRASEPQKQMDVSL
jgi:hypothetical protein